MTRLALYLQDAHPITDAIGYVQYAEQKGFEAVCGRPIPVWFVRRESQWRHLGPRRTRSRSDPVSSTSGLATQPGWHLCSQLSMISLLDE